MSLQDDIARYANKYRTVSFGLTDHIAAALERDYYLVKLADLPGVVDDGHGSWRCGLIGTPPGFSAETSRQRALEYLAVAEFLEARESEAAVLARRRDELVQRYSPSQLGYDDIQYTDRRLVDHALDAEDRAAAAEAEVARLKGETK